MMKRVIALIWILFLLLPTLARAQQPLTLETTEIALWPEYDQPSMLVILRLAFPADTSLPAEMSLRIPASAGKPNAVAAKQPDGSLVNLTYTQNQAGEWSELNFTTPTSEVQIEYYDTALVKEGTKRSYRYEWPGDIAVQNMQVQVQQPVSATEIQLPSSFGSGVVGQDGLTYYTAIVGAIPASQPLVVDLEYQKADDELTINSLSVGPAAPIDSSPSKLMSILPWLLAALGVVLIVGGVYWYWRTGRQKPVSNNRKIRHKPATEKASQSSEGYIYCHKCGKRALPGDRFCRTCGTQLRISNGS
jgi:hypothetical protein